MRVRAIWTSWGRTLTSLSSSSKSASRISSGQYMVSSTNTLSTNRSVARCSLSRNDTLATPTLPSSDMASRSSEYALTPVSSGTR